ncbi:Uncharacterised protein [Mycobacteroides abscessus]|nr:Uncharacterised protein [Mycobacteroides abscessus]
MRRAVSFPAGIQVGLGAPCPWRDVRTLRPRNPCRSEVVSELSWLCMTSAMIVRDDQPRRSAIAGRSRRRRHSSRSQVRHRLGPPSVRTVWRSPMAPDPFPYRTGSTWVRASG